jgi:methylmalonyl-CoA mutase N-terminal domain/subunit
MEGQLHRLQRFRQQRDRDAVRRALDALADAASFDDRNTFAAVVEAAAAGATHGEICARMRAVLGLGEPLIVA